MATAAELQVLIKGRDEASPMLRGFRTELRQADMLLGQFGATSRFSMLATLGWVGAAGTAIGASVGMVKSFVDTAQEIQRLTAQTGFSAEAISRLRYQASLANADIQELAPSLRLMSRSVMDAAMGVDAAAGAYTSLGLSVQELRRMAPEQQFDAIMVALAGVTDKTKQVDLAMQVFGRSGATALMLVQGGVEGYRRSVEEAAAAAPMFTDAEIAAAEKLEQTWKRIGFNIEKAKIGLVTGTTSLQFMVQGPEDGGAGAEGWLKLQEQLTTESEATAAAKKAEQAATSSATIATQDAIVAERRAILENRRQEMDASFVAAQMGRLRGTTLEEQKRLWDENTAAVKAFQAAQEALLKWPQLTAQQRMMIEMGEAREQATRELERQIPLEERRAEINKLQLDYIRLQAEGLARANAESARIASAMAVGASQERAAGIAAGGESANAVRAMFAANPQVQLTQMASDFAGRLVQQAGLGVIRGPGGEVVATTINIGQFSGTQTELDRLGEAVQNANRVRSD